MPPPSPRARTAPGRTPAPGRAPAPRTPLNRMAVLDAAIALADAEGIDAVSMRWLAEPLGVVPMALYKHVADKDDLLDGMVDRLIEQFSSGTEAGAAATTAESGQDWAAAVRGSVFSARAVIHRHPWARRVIESRTRRTPAVLGHMERVTQHFLAGGLSPDLTHHVMHLLGNRIWGFSPELFNDPGNGSRAAAQRSRTTPDPDPADYPGITAIATDARARRPEAVGCDEEFEFRFALDVILDGIERMRATGWSSPTL